MATTGLARPWLPMITSAIITGTAIKNRQARSGHKQTAAVFPGEVENARYCCQPHPPRRPGASTKVVRLCQPPNPALRHAHGKTQFIMRLECIRDRCEKDSSFNPRALPV